MSFHFLAVTYNKLQQLAANCSGLQQIADVGIVRLKEGREAIPSPSSGASQSVEFWSIL
jgi:hypothetical protein